MSSSDLYVDGFPHGTPEGYDRDCRGGACPAGVAYGLSCKVAKQKSRGDFQYRKLAKAGATVPEIAAALGLVGAETLPPPAKKTTKATPAPTPMTALGGVSMADAAAAASKAAAAGQGSVSDVPKLAAAAPVETPAAPPLIDETPAAPPLIEEKPAIQPKTVKATSAAERTSAPAPAAGEIRAWARAKGYEVGAKGKLPQYIVDHYWETTGRLTVPDETAPAPRPDWGSVAESVDVESARRWAIHFEQEHARVVETLERTERQFRLQVSILKTQLRITDEQKAIAERAAEFALLKWGEERAANESAHALILGQAHTINGLSTVLEGPRWTLGAHIDEATLHVDEARRLLQVPDAPHDDSIRDAPERPFDADGNMRPRPNTTEGVPYLPAYSEVLHRAATITERRPWWRR